ncbi:MAG: helix-turn-helix transcriptional regulator [Bacteroidales bacterium]|nr:helix-turn-helix transcriptional regulator [Bacteroidales bacterium]
MKNYLSTEMYTTPDGCVMIKPQNQPVRELAENGKENRLFIQAMLEYMRTFYIDAFHALCEEYSRKEPNRLNYEYWIVSRFIRCNMGSYDLLSHDVDHTGMLQFEDVKCPLRGECKLENVCCRPRFNSGLSHRETEVLRLTVNHYEAVQIAEKLHLSPHTVNNHRRNIHIKTKTRSIAELVEFWHKNNMK